MSLDKPLKAERTYSYLTYLIAVVFSNFFVAFFFACSFKSEMKGFVSLEAVKVASSLYSKNVQVSMPGFASVPADRIVENPALECLTLLEPN